MNNLVNLFVFLFNKLVRLGKFSKGVSLLSKETLGKPFSAAIILFGYLYKFRSFFLWLFSLKCTFPIWVTCFANLAHTTIAAPRRAKLSTIKNNL